MAYTANTVYVPKRRTYPTITEAPDAWTYNQLVRDLTTRDVDVNNAITLFEFTKTFAIDSVALITVSIDTVLGFIPNPIHCQISIVESTAVDDWGYDLLKVVSTSATSIVGKINVSNASSTGGALATMVIWLRP